MKPRLKATVKPPSKDGDHPQSAPLAKPKPWITQLHGCSRPSNIEGWEEKKRYYQPGGKKQQQKH